jgi:hypothetical protein
MAKCAITLFGSRCHTDLVHTRDLLIGRKIQHPLAGGAGSLFGEQSRVISRECRSQIDSSTCQASRNNLDHSDSCVD